MICDKQYQQELEANAQKHWYGHPIRMRFLVYERWVAPEKTTKNTPPNFIVFIDVECDLDWICDDSYSENKVSQEAFSVIAQIMEIEALPCRKIGKEEEFAFKKILGAAVVSALNEDIDGAKHLSEEAKLYIQRRIPEHSRTLVLWWATIGLLGFFCINRWLMASFFDATPLIYGLLGAYVSIVRRAGKSSLDVNAGMGLHATEPLVRLILGMILGKIAVLLLATPVAPEILQTLCSKTAGMLVAAFAAGMTDAFVPTMISTYVTDANGATGKELRNEC